MRRRTDKPTNPLCLPHSCRVQCYTVSLSLSLLLRIQPTAKNHLGSVRCLSLNPANRHQLLIGYEKGVISLWDLEKDVAIRNYPQSVQDCQQVEVRQLACLSLGGGGGGRPERAHSLSLSVSFSLPLSPSPFFLLPFLWLHENFQGRNLLPILLTICKFYSFWGETRKNVVDQRHIAFATALIAKVFFFKIWYQLLPYLSLSSPSSSSSPSLHSH